MGTIVHTREVKFEWDAQSEQFTTHLQAVWSKGISVKKFILAPRYLEIRQYWVLSTYIKSLQRKKKKIYVKINYIFSRDLSSLCDYLRVGMHCKSVIFGVAINKIRSKLEVVVIGKKKRMGNYWALWVQLKHWESGWNCIRLNINNESIY